MNERATDRRSTVDGSRESMREFEDQDGGTWVATVRERRGPDYKGSFVLFLQPEGGSEEEGVPLLDVRWNSRRTAERTLSTMSGVELRRRLRSALGRRSGSATRPS